MQNWNINEDFKNHAKSWIYDVFYVGGKTGGKPCIRSESYQHEPNTLFDPEMGMQKEVKLICDAIIFHKVAYNNFKLIDAALGKLSYTFFDCKLSSVFTNWYWETALGLATYIAYFCRENKIYWDDSLITPYEREELLKTNIGGVLHDFDCFTSQN